MNNFAASKTAFTDMNKFWIPVMAAVLALASCSGGKLMENGDVLVLDSGWTLSSEGVSGSFDAKVPSTVAGVLNEEGYFGKNLLEGKNYASIDKSIFDGVWTYKKVFVFPSAPASSQKYELVFDGLDYYADITLNGKKLASSDTTSGVFIRRAYDVSVVLKKKNTLEVSLKRAQPGDLNIGFVDWNPRPVDESMGIVRPVSLHATGDVSVEDVFVIPDLDTENFASADLKVNVTLKNHSASPVSGDLAVSFEGGEASLEVSLGAGESSVFTLDPSCMPLLHVSSPRVWWSHDLGTPEMYSLTASFCIDGKISDFKEVPFGIRKIESRLTANNYRQFTLNGKDILLKGAGWTDDIFLQDTPETLRRQVEYVKDMNLNCIRFENIWGKDDTVYDLCDRLGVLALVGWSCQWEWEDYCGLPESDGYGCINTPETEDLAVKYFRDQVVRLHNHPAIIGWMTGSDRIPNPGLEKRYMEIYSAQEYRPYINSAKNQMSTVSGWSGSKMEGPYEYVGPDYWFFDTEAGGAFGFNTETGIGANIPQIESLKKMIPESELWPISDTWNYHCTASSSAMNNMNMLTEAVNRHYGEASSLEEYVKKAHAVDYNGTGGMFAAFRVRMPLATGIVQWMLNSAWPSMYWQLYDWYGVPTAGYYGTKKACEPMQLLFNYADRSVYAVSESPEDCILTASVKVYDQDSRLLSEGQSPVMMTYRDSRPVFDLGRFDVLPHFVFLTLTDKDGKVVADNFYAIPRKDNAYDFSKTNWYKTPFTRWADLSFTFAGGENLPEVSVEKTDEGYNVTLTNGSQRVSAMNILKAKDPDGNLIVPAVWSDNFISLYPGQKKTVTLKTDVKNVNITVE